MSSSSTGEPKTVSPLTRSTPRRGAAAREDQLGQRLERRADVRLAQREQALAAALDVEHRLVLDEDDVGAAGAGRLAGLALALRPGERRAVGLGWLGGGEDQGGAVCLTYVDQGSVRPTIDFGLEADRRRWLDSDMDKDDMARALWYPIGNVDHPLNCIDTDIISSDLDVLMLREAALKQREDPYRAVLSPVAANLARHDWTGVLTATEDFVVFIAEHDEGFSLKHASVREVNPPERVAVWDARWPTGTPRDD
jgi:hypothetical protein